MAEGKLGAVTGVIRLATDSFTRSRQIIQQESQAISKAVESTGESVKKVEKIHKGSLASIANSFDLAEKSAKKFNNTPLGKIGKGLEDVQTQVLTVTAAFGAMAIAGLNAAKNTDMNVRAIRGLAGSAEQANKILAKTQKISDEFGIPYADLAEGARAFLPIAQTTGVEIEKLLMTATRFQKYAPQKSFGEVKFSINEALSGDFVSIKDALDLSKKQREELKAVLEKDGPQALLAEIDKILQERGFTDDYIRANIDAFQALGSEVNQALTTAFKPILDNFVIPIVKGLSDFFKDLRENNPEILKFGGAFTVAVAGVGSLLTAITALIGAYKTLSIVSEMTGGKLGKFAGMAGKAGLGVGALALGSAGGVALVDALAKGGMQGGSFDRIRKGEKAGDVIGETAKQALVIVVKLITDGLIGIIRLIVDAFSNLVKVVNFVRDVFSYFGTFIGELVGSMQKMMGELLVGLADSLSGLFDTTSLRDAGKLSGAVGEKGVLKAQNDRAELQARLAQGIVMDGSAGNDFMKQATEAQNSLLKGFTDMLFPVAQETTEELESVSDALQAVGDSAEYLAKQREEIVDAVTKYNDDVKKIEDDKQKDLLALNAKYADEQVKIAEDAVEASTKALEKLQDARQKLEVDFTRDSDKQERELQRSILDKQIEAQRKEQEDYQGHLDKLVDIRQKAQEKEQDLLMNLDFKGLFEASQSKKRAIDAENDAFVKQRQEKNKNLQYDIEDMQRNAQAQREERLIQYQLSMADLQANYNKEMVEIQRQRDQKLNLAGQAFRADLAQLQNKYIMELNMRRQAVQEELQFLSLSEAQRAKIMMDSQTKIIAQAQSLLNTITTARGGSTAKPIVTPTTTTIKPTSTVFSGGNNTRTIATRANGGGLMAGQMSLVNEGFAGQLERFVTGGQSYALAGGAGLFMPLKGGMIQPNGGDKSVTVNISGNFGGMNPNDLGRIVADKVASVINDMVS